MAGKRGDETLQPPYCGPSKNCADCANLMDCAQGYAVFSLANSRGLTFDAWDRLNDRFARVVQSRTEVLRVFATAYPEDATDLFVQAAAFRGDDAALQKYMEGWCSARGLLADWIVARLATMAKSRMWAPGYTGPTFWGGNWGFDGFDEEVQHFRALVERLNDQTQRDLVWGGYPDRRYTKGEAELLGRYKAFTARLVAEEQIELEAAISEMIQAGKSEAERTAGIGDFLAQRNRQLTPEEAALLESVRALWAAHERRMGAPLAYELLAPPGAVPVFESREDYLERAAAHWDARALYFEGHGWRTYRAKQELTAHARWLLQYQVQHISYTKIAEEAGAMVPAVQKGIKRLAALIDLPLRTNK